MRKTLFILVILTAFTVAGCSGEEKPKYDQNGNKIEYNEKGERVYKMGTPKKSFADFEKGKSNEGLHQFKTNKQ